MTEQSKKTEEKKELLLGIDYGEKRVGLALGINGIVQPLTVVDNYKDESAIAEIAKYIFENKVNKIVLGLPVNYEGKETPMSLQVRKFAKMLKIRTKKKVLFENEYRTSADSLTEAIHLGKSKKRRQEIDHLSAALILKHYYSRKASN